MTGTIITAGTAAARRPLHDDDAPILSPPGPLSFPTIQENAGTGLPGEPANNGSTVQAMLSSKGDGAAAVLPATNTASLPAPTETTLTVGSGGTLTSGIYYYEVTATLGGGETTVSNEQSVVISGLTGQVTVNWNAVAGATGYNV